MGNASIRSAGPATSCDHETAPIATSSQRYANRSDLEPESYRVGETVGSDTDEQTGTDTESRSEPNIGTRQGTKGARIVTFQLPSPADDAHVSWLRLRYHEAVARIGHSAWLSNTLPRVANVLRGAGEITPPSSLRYPHSRARRNAPVRVRPSVRVSRRRRRLPNQDCETLLLRTFWPVRQTEQLFLPSFPVDERRDLRYEPRVHLANGAFGRVYRVGERSTGHEQQPEEDHSAQYALKALRKSDIISSDAVRQLSDEVNIQTICGHHPFIVRCIDFWQTRTHIFLLSKYYANGELFQRLKIFNFELTRLYVAELAVALDFLHNAGIVYRDLKPENILLDEGYHIKLIDFGFSKWLSIGSRTGTLCGTAQYMGKEA